MLTPYSNIISVTTLSLLLDTYSGAAAAYSLRQLSSTYSGDAIRVRRASDNTEQDIGFVNNELDTTSLITFCSGTDGFVTTWYDQSGNGYNATQTTASYQPQIVSSGSVITQGGKPSVYTTVSGGKNLNTGLLTLPVSGDIDLDFFAVINQQSSGLPNHLFALTDNTTNTDRRKVFCYGIDSATKISVRLYGGYIEYDNTTTGQLLFNTNYQGGGGAFDSRINGSSLNVSNYSNTGLNIATSSGFKLFSCSTDSPTLGSAVSSSIGYLQEVIFYLSDESSNRTGIETNINANYQIYWDGSQTSLLDTYSGSAAAYSLRALSSSYTGPLVRVRRASDNAEQDIYAKYDGTLNVDALESFCSGTNGFVKTWYDQSGNGYDASQTTAASQPQIVSSGLLINVNSKPSIKLDGSNDFLTIGNLMSGLTSSTGFFVAKATSTSSITQNSIHDICTSDDSHFKYFNGITYDGYCSTVRKSWTDTINYSLQNIIAITSYNNFYNAYVNNNSIYNTNTNTFNSKSTNLLGKGPNPSFFDGNYQEVIIYASEQTSNLNGINNNINTYYGIY